MLNLPRRQTAPIPSLYERLGLTDLPFPTEPLLDPYSPDPRRNGSIYAQSPVQGAIEKFERLLIRPGDFPNRAKIASLWADGDSASGRGMGKSALLRFFQQRINTDWGTTQFDGAVLCLRRLCGLPGTGGPNAGWSSWHGLRWLTSVKMAFWTWHVQLCAVKCSRMHR